MKKKHYLGLLKAKINQESFEQYVREQLDCLESDAKPDQLADEHNRYDIEAPCEIENTRSSRLQSLKIKQSVDSNMSSGNCINHIDRDEIDVSSIAHKRNSSVKWAEQQIEESKF
jgi:hypothetical protein